jgi:hypothetical protein
MHIAEAEKYAEELRKYTDRPVTWLIILQEGARACVSSLRYVHEGEDASALADKLAHNHRVLGALAVGGGYCLGGCTGYKPLSVSCVMDAPWTRLFAGEDAAKYLTSR